MLPAALTVLITTERVVPGSTISGAYVLTLFYCCLHAAAAAAEVVNKMEMVDRKYEISICSL